MPINCKHENLKFARYGCFMPELGVSRILWECVDCRTILSFNIKPAPNKVLRADAAKPPITEEALQILEQCFPYVREQ